MKFKEIEANLNIVYDYNKKDFNPQKEENVIAFEKKYNVNIPQQFRNLILNYGIKTIGCDPHYYTLDELNEWGYTNFIDLYKEHKYEWKTDDGINPFPLGVFGASSEAFIDTNTGKVYMFYYEDEIEYLKEDVYSLLNMQIGIEIDLMKNYL